MALNPKKDVVESELEVAVEILKRAEPLEGFMYVLRMKRAYEELIGRKVTLDEYADLLLQAEDIISQTSHGT